MGPSYLACALLVVSAGDLGARSYAQPGNYGYASLKAWVARRLAWDCDLAPFRLDVEVNGAVVKLIGAVSTGTESRRADRIAHDVTGVQAVVNGLTVDPALATSASTHHPGEPVAAASQSQRHLQRIAQLVAQGLDPS